MAGNMKELKINKEEIDSLFLGTNFGDKTDETFRRGLMIECVLKIASGYGEGRTISLICQEAGILNKNFEPTKAGMRWAFDQLYSLGSKETILERLS